MAAGSPKLLYVRGGVLPLVGVPRAVLDARRAPQGWDWMAPRRVGAVGQAARELAAEDFFKRVSSRPG